MLSIKLHLTGVVLLLCPVLTSQASAPVSITCVTRGADLIEDGQVVLCPPDCDQWRLSVFGTTVYAAVSSVCGAALHRGLLGSVGRSVKYQKLPGRYDYKSSYSHGVRSQSLARWTASFSLTRPASIPQELSSHTNTTPILQVKKTEKKPPVKKALSGGNKECQVEIAMVTDSSQALGLRRFNLQKSFLSRLASALRVGPTGPHMCLVQPGDSPRTEFYLTNHTQPKDLLAAIRELPYRGEVTNTGKAVLHALQGLFTPEAGVRRGHPRVLVALVDGWPADELDQAGLLARESGVNLFLVSVARPVAEEMNSLPNQDFIAKAVCKDNGFFSYHIPSWFTATKHIKTLVQRFCSLDDLLCSKTCYNSVNIGFLIDGSSSVGTGNFRTVLDFLASITQNFDISDVGARIGAVQFTYDQRLEFGMFDHPAKDESIAAIRSIYYMSGGTATGVAITYASQQLFRRAGPGRNFLIVVTDGQSYDDMRGPALAAHKLGITIYSVGVAWAPLDDLRAMASQPHDTHTFFTREFSGLSDFVQPITRGICRDFNDAN